MRKINLLALMVGVLYSVGITVMSILLMGLYVFISSGKTFYFPGTVVVIIGASIIAGGFKSGNMANSGGWINGAATGLIYAILLLVMQSRLFPVLFSGTDIVIQSALFVVLGAIGGVVGVNVPQRGRRPANRRGKVFG